MRAMLQEAPIQVYASARVQPLGMKNAIASSNTLSLARIVGIIGEVKSEKRAFLLIRLD
jgi:hypothetical protein